MGVQDKLASADGSEAQPSASAAQARELVLEVRDLVVDHYLDARGAGFDKDAWRRLVGQALRGPLADNQAAYRSGSLGVQRVAVNCQYHLASVCAEVCMPAGSEDRGGLQKRSQLNSCFGWACLMLCKCVQISPSCQARHPESGSACNPCQPDASKAMQLPSTTP